MRCVVFTRKRERTTTWDKRTDYSGSLEHCKTHCEKLLDQDQRHGDLEADRAEVLIVETKATIHGDIEITRVQVFEAHSGQIVLEPS